MKNRLFALLAILASATALPISAEAYNSLGQCGVSCGTWVEYRKSREYFPLSASVLGYISGVAFSTGVDLARDIDSAAVIAWVDKYCAAHPLNKVADAAETLAKELEGRQKRPAKK